MKNIQKAGSSFTAANEELVSHSSQCRAVKIFDLYKSV